VGCRSLVKTHIRRCVICVRQAAKNPSQLMGDLPSPRVNPSSPFSHTGVDYAGPFSILPFVGRGQRPRKHYVALFICLATKAIHLECVEDYATTSFLAAFCRFVSRRGLPSHMYSNNGTNFRGANRELQASFEVISIRIRSYRSLWLTMAYSDTLFPRPHLISGDSGKRESKALNFTSGDRFPHAL